MPSKTEVSCDVGESIFDVAKRAKISVETACVGKGTCGLCRVKILEGEDSLNPVGPIDERHMGNVYFLTKTRLACQAFVSGDVTVLPVKKKKRGQKK